jgi:hypothetical protein
MIPAIRLVKVSSQRAESVISHRYFCRKLIETLSVSVPNRSLFSPGAIATHADLSARYFQHDSAPNPVVRFLAAECSFGKLGPQAVAPGHGISPSVDERVDTEGEIQPIGPA